MRNKIVKKDIKKDVKKNVKKSLFTKKYIQKILTCNVKDCALFNLNKHGDLIDTHKAYLVNYLQLLNLLNNIQSYAYIKFPLFYGRSEKDILDKIAILNQCAQERIVFYIEKYFDGKREEVSFDNMYEPNKVLNIVFLKHSNIEKFVKIYFLNEVDKKSIRDFDIQIKSIEEKLGFLYLTHSFMTYDKPKDEIISVQLFYGEYIHMIRDEIYEKYNIDFRDTNIVENYQKLYALLDKLGYVNKFYKKLYPKAKLLSSKVEKKIVAHPKYIEYLKYFNSYKPFEDKILFDIQDINIERLIKTHIHPSFDIKYILQEYTKIRENNNFGIRM